MSVASAPHASAEGFARLAASCCGVEAGIVLLAEADQFKITAAFGLQGEAADLRGNAIFAATAKRDDILEVVARPRPGAAGERHVYRFYAGIAIRATHGAVIGILAVLDPYARMLEPRAREELRLLAQSFPALGASSPDHVSLIEAVLARSPDPALLYRLPTGSGAATMIASNRAFRRSFAVDTAGLVASDGAVIRGPRTDGVVSAAIRGAQIARKAMRATIALYCGEGDRRAARWFDVSGYPVANNDGEIGYWVEQYHDVTERAERITELAAERNRLHATLASMDDAVVTTDRFGRLLLVNSAARALLGIRDVTPQARRIDDGVLQLREIDSEALITSPLLHVRRNGRAERRRALILAKNDARRYVEYAVAPIERPDREQDGYVIVMRDVTAEESLTRRLSFEASHDQLTGISNRRYFEQSLSRALVGAKADDATQHALAFLDLDRFKAINDSCGHAAGDQVLREIAKLFKAQLRSHDVIARFGGDEFAILMHDCTIMTAARVMQRVRAAIASYEWLWQSRRYSLDVSIGLSAITSATKTTEEALKEADLACYADKLGHRTAQQRMPVLRSELAASHEVPWLR